MGRDFGVIAISQVVEDNTPLPADQRKQFTQAQGSMRGQQELMDYIAFLRGQAKIEEVKSEKN
jgi:peptidyl-prolyl cis-trans isomerase D